MILHIFLFSFNKYISSLVKYLLKSSAHLKNWVILLFIIMLSYIFNVEFIYSGYKFLSDISFSNTFSYSVACLFMYLIVSFEEWKF